MSCVVISESDSAGASNQPLIRQLRQAHPGISIVVAGRSSRLLGQNVRAVVLAGEDQFAFMDIESDESLSELFASVLLHPVPAAVLRRVSSAGAGMARVMLVWCLHGAMRPMRVNQVADNFGVSLRTCNRRLADSSIAPLVEVISYSRALRAALLLEDADQPVAVVAAELGFPGDQALRMHIKRRMGVTPTICRGGQVREQLLDALPLTTSEARTKYLSCNVRLCSAE